MSVLREISKRARVEALNNVGVHEEGSSNWSPSVKIYLNSVGIKSPAPWCAGFTYYRLVDAARDLGLKLTSQIPKSGYTPDWKDAAIKYSRWIPVATARSTPSRVKPGDLVLFYFPNMGRIAHIGIVDSVTSTGVWTIEGNTSATAEMEGVERNGGCVARKFRRWGALGLRGGFVDMD